MATLGKLIVDIAADTSQLKTDLAGARQELGSFRGAVEGGVSGLMKMGTSLLKIGAAAITVRAVVDQIRDVIVQTGEAERVQLRLAAVVKATGGAANISAKEMKQLAEEVSRSSFFDDEQIIAAEAQLATFGEIQGQVFRDAVRLGTDVASVFEKDVTTAVLAVGKALASPVEGMTALRRIGVVFTEEQKKTIQGMVEMNNVAGAQREILKALEERVGGAAGDESSGVAGAFHRLRLRIDDAKKALGSFFLGTDKEAAGLADAIEQAFKKGAGLIPLRPSKPLDELTGTVSREELTKATQDRLSLLGAGRASAGDIRALQDTARADAEALKRAKEFNLTLAERARLAKELVTIQEALKRAGEDALAKRKGSNLGINLGALGDFTREGATVQEQQSMLGAASVGRLSSAMQGVGGQTGGSPYRDFLGQTKSVAQQWRDSWKTAIEAGAQTMADFFQRALEGGMELKDFLRGLLASIAAPFWALVGQQAAGAIGKAVGIPIAAAGGAPSPSVGTVSPSMGSLQVNQNITFAISALDGPSVAQMLRTQGGTIAGVVADAATAAPAFARHIVAQGLRR